MKVCLVFAEFSRGKALWEFWDLCGGVIKHSCLPRSADLGTLPCDVDIFFETAMLPHMQAYLAPPAIHSVCYSLYILYDSSYFTYWLHLLIYFCLLFLSTMAIFSLSTVVFLWATRQTIFSVAVT
jgi:hypothetical protein